MSKKPVIAITMGDPAGIGPEIALKGALDPRVRARCHPLIVGSIPVLEAVRERMGLAARLIVDSRFVQAEAGAKDGAFAIEKAATVHRVGDGDNDGDDADSDDGADGGDAVSACDGADGGDDRVGSGVAEVGAIDLNNCTPADFAMGQISPVCGRVAYEYIERSIRLALAGAVQAVVTGPIHKVSLNQSGVPHPGHTEIFSALTNTAEYAMMLVSGSLRVSHVTTHVALADVAKRIVRSRVLKVIRLTHDAVKQMGVSKPCIAVAGLNPHAGEGGLFGSEDEGEIRPAVLEAKEAGMHVEGPIPPDTVFVKALAGQYDAVVAMYHDQGHIPVKLSGFKVDAQTGAWTAVTGINVTLGLPIIRTSVDHGVAFDIAGRGIASHESMLDAIHLAVDMAGGPRAFAC